MVEFGLCVQWLSHIPKLHLYWYISEGRLLGPHPLLVLSARPPTSPACVPKAPGKDRHFQKEWWEGSLGFPGLPGEGRAWGCCADKLPELPSSQ